jgi:hypothetical protein
MNQLNQLRLLKIKTITIKIRKEVKVFESEANWLIIKFFIF